MLRGTISVNDTVFTAIGLEKSTRIMDPGNFYGSYGDIMRPNTQEGAALATKVLSLLKTATVMSSFQPDTTSAPFQQSALGVLKGCTVTHYFATVNRVKRLILRRQFDT